MIFFGPAEKPWLNFSGRVYPE